MRKQQTAQEIRIHRVLTFLKVRTQLQRTESTLASLNTKNFIYRVLRSHTKSLGELRKQVKVGF